LLYHEKGKTFQRISTEIQSSGYWFRSNNAVVLNTKEHTRIPQNRERLYMVAMNWDFFRKNDFIFPGEEEGLDRDYAAALAAAAENLFLNLPSGKNTRRSSPDCGPIVFLSAR